ncbi:MAG TPA: ATP-binding cassette domain-containing protein, partial [Acidobacteriota bacterium]|nr:ATP-binding cassette domain-containing protein [Acidobacteriota bacterium]
EKKGFIKDMLTPSYRSISAVSNISFSINKGEIIGFIGPNGAGKTTTIKMLCGILWPTSGNVVIDGLVPWEQRKKHVAKIGAVFGQRKSFWPELSVKENLQLIAAIYKAPESRIDAVKFDLKLDSFFDQPFRKLSLGQQMKAELAGAIIHQPSILFLDEPTIGMDIVAKSEFMELLKKVNEKAKTTILLTSHDLHEIELLCKRIIIVNQKILYDGLLEKIRPSKVQVTLTKGSSQKSMVIEKSQVKSMLDKDYDDIKIEEIPIEEIIREYYK